MKQQLSHHTSPFEERRFPIILISDGIASPANIGGIFRLADAFSIEKIILCGAVPSLESPRLKKTSRATVERVPFEVKESSLNTCLELKSQDYALMALEITSNSSPIHSQNFSNFEKIALVVGNENLGVDEQILKITDNNIHINMFGENSSMNVTQATGIALYEITKTLPHI